MAVDETLLEEIVRRVLTVSRPDKIILFGSAATGQMTKDSDIDLLAVEPAPPSTRERSVEILNALRDIRYPFDVIVMRTERFELPAGSRRAPPGPAIRAGAAPGLCYSRPYHKAWRRSGHSLAFASRWAYRTFRPC